MKKAGSRKRSWRSSTPRAAITPAPRCSGTPAPQAGFTTGEPWLKVNPNYPQINVAQALADPNSIFYYYQKLIQLRKTIPAVVYGSYDLILPEHEQIYAFTRTLDDERLLVVLNFSTSRGVRTAR